MNEGRVVVPFWMRIIFYVVGVPITLLFMLPHLAWLFWLVVGAVLCALVKHFFIGGSSE